ncbi:MAG: hypothetical protein Q7U99_14225 [Rubrivivax sp.]|nr:hypothetical protein [Rubrivivax sp.]
MAQAPTPASQAPPLPAAMQLSVWLDAAAHWHARLVLPDARVLDFDSPLLLAQFLGRVATPVSGPRPPPAKSHGLR